MLSRRSTGARRTAATARVGCAGGTVHRSVFPGQPENKATPASIVPYEYVFRGFALSRVRLELPPHVWWARVTVAGGYGYLFADNADLARWQIVVAVHHSGDFAEYKDFGGGVYRAAIVCRRSHRDMPVRWSRAGCGRLGGGERTCFALDALAEDRRRMLLSGESIDGVESCGPIVCACFGVGRITIGNAITAGARTAAEIGVQLRAGTNCGSCIPELKRLIAQANVATAAADPERRQSAAASKLRQKSDT